MQTRIVGIDAARAVALAAMIVAHLTVSDGLTAQLLFGFPAGLFAFLAGVSMGLMRARPAQFVVRGACLIALHIALVPFAGTIEVVLGTIGVCMIALAWVPRLADGVLLWLFGALTLGSAALAPSVSPYPPLMWAALMVAGMLFSRRMPLVPGAAIGFTLFAADVAFRWWVPLPPWLSAAGHAGGLLDVVGTVGASLGMCSLCCLAGRWLGWLAPLGRITLTLYCLHVVTAQWLGVWPSLAGAAVVAYGWLAVFARGPVEEVVRRLVAAVGKDHDEEVGN